MFICQNLLFDMVRFKMEMPIVHWLELVTWHEVKGECMLFVGWNMALDI